MKASKGSLGYGYSIKHRAIDDGEPVRCILLKCQNKREVNTNNNEQV